MIYRLTFFMMLCSTVASAQKMTSLDFYPLFISETCQGAKVIKNLQIDQLESDEENPTPLTYLGSNNESMEFYFCDELIDINKTIFIKTYHDLRNLRIEFTLEKENQETEIYFSQKSAEKERNNTVKIHNGCYYVNSKIKELTISDACQDSVTLLLPFQGTQTDLYISKYENGAFTKPISRFYYCCSYGNELKVATQEKARYKFGMTGCHTKGTEFELQLN